MKTLLSKAGRAFLKAFVSSIIVLGVGILAAPNLDQAFAVGVAALFASLAAGVTALQAFVPQLSFDYYLEEPFGQWADAFIQAFLGAFLTSVVGLLNAPHEAGWKAAVIGAVVGAFNMGLRALQGALTVGESPAKRKGLRLPRWAPE